jgi:hypothetical protein
MGCQTVPGTAELAEQMLSLPSAVGVDNEQMNR